MSFSYFWGGPHLSLATESTLSPNNTCIQVFHLLFLTGDSSPNNTFISFDSTLLFSFCLFQFHYMHTRVFIYSIIHLVYICMLLWEKERFSNYIQIKVQPKAYTSCMALIMPKYIKCLMVVSFSRWITRI